MTSLSVSEQEKSLFAQNEQPPANLQQSESLDGMKRIHSFSSSLTSATLPNQQRQPYRSLSSHDLISSSPLSSFHTQNNNNLNDNDLFVNPFDRRLTDHFLLWEKEYDKRVQQMNEIKCIELNKLKLYYETKLRECEDSNRQLEVHSGQINQENKRLKIEIEHEKQHNKIEQTTLEQHLKEFKSHLERKIHEIKIVHEHDKQDIKQQHSRIYQDLLDETNQRLKQMENNYKYQQSTNETVVEEMGKRLVQELTNRQRHIDRNNADKIQRYDNEIKSINLRCESTVDLLRKENDILKSKSRKTIDDLETKLLKITEQFHEIEKAFELKTNEQQLSYHNKMKQCENDYEKIILALKQELKEQNKKYILSIHHNEQIQNELRQLKHKITIDLENQIQEMNDRTHETEQMLMNKLKFEYEQANHRDQEKLREKFNKEIQDIKRKYEQIVEKNEETVNNDLKKLDQASVDTKRTHEIEKQQLVNHYEQYIRKLETNCENTNNEYEKRIEKVISKAHEQVKSMEDEYEARFANQQAIINDQQKTIQSFKDEENRAKTVFEKQCKILNEQSLREKNEIKAQFDLCMKNLEKNFSTLASKKEQLERKLSYLKEHHKNEMMEFRLTYEKNIKGLLTNDVRLDLENTIFSLKQQVVYLQQRIAFLQKELEQLAIPTMEVFESFYRNPILREYLDPKQLQVTPWVLDPIGIHHPFVFDFEKKFFDKTYAHNIYNWMNKWWWLSIVYSIIYVGFIYYGRSLMEKRERFELRLPLILWNVALASFSIFGMIRCVPEMIYGIDKRGLQYTICDNSNIYGVTGFWITIFCISKVPELIDTLFIVLRKQKLIFLHWFHHATVLVYAWYSYHDWTASGRWFVFLNYSVHALMYSYYAFRAMKFQIPKWISVTVTTFQLSQMVVGCFVNYKAYVYKQNGAACDVAYANIFWSFVMYAVYFGLFLHFFFVSYLSKKPTAKVSFENERKKNK
ncbi:unnamed protein product [Rotaria magnacalcarata]|uniref:Elongation of very long chain fatty acids protein n=1 Tax=Rotaria magnacalcarata TaxID=392030 RepID=A0A816Z6C6_9BILA|nr:unnamed protein product [Rotaria magnacalcarata]